MPDLPRHRHNLVPSAINMMTYFNCLLPPAFVECCCSDEQHLCLDTARLRLNSRASKKRVWRPWLENIRHRIVLSSAPKLSSWPRKAAPMTKLPTVFRCLAKSSANGANASLRNDWPAWKMNPAPGVRPFFPPEVVVQVKALACELPAQTDLPLSRFSRQDLAREAIARGIVAHISGARALVQPERVRSTARARSASPRSRDRARAINAARCFSLAATVDLPPMTHTLPKST